MPSAPTSIDSLIADIANGPRTPAPGDRLRILGHVAQAPFSNRQDTLVGWEGFVFGTLDSLLGDSHPSNPGTRLTAQTVLSSRDYHVAKHTKDGGWKPGTKPQQYLADLRAAISCRYAKLVVGLMPTIPGSQSRRPGAAIWVELGVPGLVVPQVAKGPGWTIFTVYDAHQGVLLTGYTVMDALVPQRLAGWSNIVRVRI